MLDILKGIIAPILGPLLDKIPDVNERNRLEKQAESNLLKAITSVVQAQIQVNMKEAEHPSVFVAGWRPAIGWICGAGLGWNYIIQPIIVWLSFLTGVDISNAPSLEIGELVTLLVGMLGLGTFRTYEKRVGVARTGWGPTEPK